MKKGFTLAEVLITLGVIGVIAVLTVPSVIQDYKNKLYVAQLKKAYLDITNGVLQEINDEHVDDFHMTKGAAKQTGAKYFLTNYISHVRGESCTGIDCITKLSGKSNISYENIDGENAGTFAAAYAVTTKYGAIITMRTPDDGNLVLYVDVNGAEPPNTTGRDLFSFIIRENTNEVTDASTNPANCNAGTSTWYDSIMSYTAGCFQSIIKNNWQMKY